MLTKWSTEKKKIVVWVWVCCCPSLPWFQNYTFGIFYVKAYGILQFFESLMKFGSLERNQYSRENIRQIFKIFFIFRNIWIYSICLTSLLRLYLYQYKIPFPFFISISLMQKNTNKFPFSSETFKRTWGGRFFLT